jgi:hypothetical protein
VSRPLAQPEPLHLAGERPRQVVDEVDQMRVLVAAHALLAPGPQLVGQSVVARLAARTLDVGGDAAGVVDTHSHDADAGHTRMLHEGVLHVHRRDPEAADLEHVVDAAHVGVGAILGALVAIAGGKPVAQHRGLALLVLVPVEGRARVAAHEQGTDARALQRGAAVIDELELVAGHGPAGGARPHVAGAIGAVDMQHLGRTDPIDDVDAEALTPPVERRRRQRLGRRHAEAHRLHRAVGFGIARQQPEQSRHAEEHRRPVVAQRLKDGRRLGRSRHQDRGAPEPQRKGQAVAQAVGMKQLGGGEVDVVGPETQHGSGVLLAGHADVVLEVHDALGLAGGARAVEPEGHVVAVGGRGVELI